MIELFNNFLNKISKESIRDELNEIKFQDRNINETYIGLRDIGRDIQKLIEEILEKYMLEQTLKLFL